MSDGAALVCELAALLQRWSYEGTTGAERIVSEVGARYGVAANAVFLPDSATVTVDGDGNLGPLAPWIGWTLFALGMLIGAVLVRRPLAAGT